VDCPALGDNDKTTKEEGTRNEMPDLPLNNHKKIVCGPLEEGTQNGTGKKMYLHGMLIFHV
jgi:hypothetical protein